MGCSINCVHNILGTQNKWSSNPFSDVLESAYYYKAIEYVYNKKLMGGTSSSRFSPTTALSRSDLAMIVCCRAGNPSVTGLSNPFTDVSSSAEYYNAVKWVYNNGTNIIMGGTSSTKFEPSSYVTREMMAVVMDRYATRRNISLSKIRTYSAFTDNGQISSWAKDPVIKMYEAV